MLSGSAGARFCSTTRPLRRTAWETTPSGNVFIVAPTACLGKDAGVGLAIPL